MRESYKSSPRVRASRGKSATIDSCMTEENDQLQRALPRDETRFEKDAPTIFSIKSPKSHQQFLEAFAPGKNSREERKFILLRGSNSNILALRSHTFSDSNRSRDSLGFASTDLAPSSRSRKSAPLGANFFVLLPCCRIYYSLITAFWQAI